MEFIVPQLLIVTSESDVHADFLIKELSTTKSIIEPVRLNTESFIQKSQYYWAWDALGNVYNQSLFFQDSLREAKEIKVIWWRKPEIYYPYPEVEDEWAVKYSEDETKSLIFSLPGLYPNAMWVNNYYNLRLPSQRINQIPIAKQLGILVPPTLVTNCYEPALDFLKHYGNCIIKPMNYSGFLHKDKQYGCYTHTLDIETLNVLRESIHLAPVFLQKRIPKKAEYRVTLIGDKSFVCRIESKHLDDLDVALDWRITEPERLIHVPDTLPDFYLSKLHQMLKILGLHFGAFDVICDDNDELYLIELNPNGQWYWIEALTGMPMAKAMVELIEKLASL
jgi:hypothetical protein